MRDKIEEQEQRLKKLESRFSELGYDMTALVQSEFKKKWKIPSQFETHYGMLTALCIDTIDPWKQNKVRWFNPLFHSPDLTVKALPWAYPISSMGGFDDCGLNWVPPAGSTLCIIFENGARQTPYYMGTTWHRDRGPAGQEKFKFNIDEYFKIHQGKRDGYLAGANDGSQVFPQWNTESYNGFDIDSIVDFNEDPEAQRKITYPNIYGFKTPQKHMMKLVDGDYKCNHRWKRVELLSGCGNWMIMKDDHLHDCGTWAHPNCGVSGSEHECEDEFGSPVELTECEGDTSNSSILGGHPSTSDNKSNTGSNPYFKHESECRPYKGPQTPQNNRCELPQTGVQFLSISGHSFVMDDSVEEPSGVPEWKRSTEGFDFGCNDKYVGKTFWVSATGHRIEMSDKEEETNIRGEENYIKLLSANGNRIELNDHTEGIKGDSGCPPNIAGEKRGITLESTSRHHIMMIDEDNEQCGPARKEGGTPINRAKKAFVRIRTGYGLEMVMADDDSQEDTVKQYVRIYCPQKDNNERGPHILHFQEKPSGPGLVFLRVGGDYVCSTYDNHITVVGDVEDNPSNKIVMVSDNYIEMTENLYMNAADFHFFCANKVIILGAGLDLPPLCADDKGGCNLCLWPVLVLAGGVVRASDRDFASASADAPCLSIFQMMPFHKCPPIPSCSSAQAAHGSGA